MHINMKIISFDVGIRNLAYCILEYKTKINIIHWNCISLMEQYDCHYKNCDNRISYKQEKKYWCKTHMNEKKLTILSKSLHSHKVKELHELCKLHNIPYNKNKHNLILALKPFTCIKVKSKNAKRESLLQLGITLQKTLDDIHETYDYDYDYIIIENQMTSKMRCLQVMLMQYFIGKTNSNIQFISGSKKLSNYFPNFDKKKTLTYQSRKSYAIDVVYSLLDNHPIYSQFMKLHKKKDDLADCLLQGLWFISNKNKIKISKIY